MNIKYMLHKGILIVMLFVCACTSYSKITTAGTASEEKYIDNIAEDYSRHGKYKSDYKVFRISINDTISTQAFYHVTILPILSPIMLNKENRIGTKTKSVPTDFLEINGKLFLWADTNKFINRETLNKMDEYKVLDSFFIKYLREEVTAAGDTITIYPSKKMLPQGVTIPEEIIHDGIEAANYFICKRNFKRFKVRYSTYSIVPTNYPKFNCD